MFLYPHILCVSTALYSSNFSSVFLIPVIHTLTQCLICKSRGPGSQRWCRSSVSRKWKSHRRHQKKPRMHSAWSAREPAGSNTVKYCNGIHVTTALTACTQSALSIQISHQMRGKFQDPRLWGEKKQKWDQIWTVFFLSETETSQRAQTVYMLTHLPVTGY